MESIRWHSAPRAVVSSSRIGNNHSTIFLIGISLASPCARIVASHSRGSSGQDKMHDLIPAIGVKMENSGSFGAGAWNFSRFLMPQIARRAFIYEGKPAPGFEPGTY